MSLKLTISVKDTATPAIQRLRAKLTDLSPLNRSIGLGLVAITQRAFDEPNLRPATWPPKKDGSISTLRKHGILWRSPRVITFDSLGVTIGSDRPYAAIHQLGKPFPWRRGQKKGGDFPARPYFPILNGQLTPPAQTEISRILARYLG